MHRRLHKLLLVLITLSVALAPLRGAWALPDTGPAETESHCAAMQHDMQQMHHHAAPGDKTDSKHHPCGSGCDKSCCQQGCTTCLHNLVAVPASLAALRDTSPVVEHRQTGADRFPERHLKPPLRPPLALR